MLFGLIAMVGWGVSDLIAAYLSRKVGSFRTFAITRVMGLVLILLLAALFLRPVVLSPSTILMVLVTAFVGLVANLSYYKGFTIGEVSVMSPIASTYPVVTVLLSVLLLKESLSPLQVAAVKLGHSGLRSDFGQAYKRAQPQGQAGHARCRVCRAGFAGLGSPDAAGGVLANSIGWYLPILLVNLATVLLYLLPASRLYRKDLAFPMKGTVASVLLLSAVMVLFDTTGMLSYSAATTVTYIAIVATVSSIYPVITILLARAVFKERPSANQRIGICMVLLALFLLAV